MINKDKRVRIITGHYGSGKSEFSINYALKLRQESSSKVALADLDVVNVYFRTREKRELLEKENIEVIDSSISTQTLDLPALSSRITIPMVDKSYDYVIDLGGDNVGARVIGRFNEYIREDEYDLFCVVNTNREKTQTVDSIITYIREIEKSSRLKVTGLINNTHMGSYTTLEDIKNGENIINEVSNMIDIPIKYTVIEDRLLQNVDFSAKGEIFNINILMRESWM